MLWYFLYWLIAACVRRQRGSVVRVGDLNAEDPDSNPRLGLLNLSSVIPGANSPRFVNSQLVCLLPVGILNWERGFLIYDTEKPLQGRCHNVFMIYVSICSICSTDKLTLVQAQHQRSIVNRFSIFLKLTPIRNLL